MTVRLDLHNFHGSEATSFQVYLVLLESGGSRASYDIANLIVLSDLAIFLE